MSDLRYTDYCRRLCLLGSDMVDIEKRLSDLRNEILDLPDAPEMFADEFKELENMLERVKTELFQAFDGLKNKLRKPLDNPPAP